MELKSIAVEQAKVILALLAEKGIVESQEMMIWLLFALVPTVGVETFVGETEMLFLAHENEKTSKHNTNSEIMLVSFLTVSPLNALALKALFWKRYP